jgi:hypothetical protein
MLAVQRGNCALCGKALGPAPEGKQRHQVDHDHTGNNGRKCNRDEVRGIVHTRCNQLIGIFEMDPEIFDKIQKYLEKHARVGYKKTGTT